MKSHSNKGIHKKGLKKRKTMGYYESDCWQVSNKQVSLKSYIINWQY